MSTFQIGLNALSAILEKAETFAVAQKIDPVVLLNTRLYSEHVSVGPAGASRGRSG